MGIIRWKKSERKMRGRVRTAFKGRKGKSEESVLRLRRTIFQTAGRLRRANPKP